MLKYFQSARRAEAGRDAERFPTKSGLHPKVEKLVIKRSGDGQKPVPWEKVKEDLAL